MMTQAKPKIDIRALENAIVEILDTGVGFGKRTYYIDWRDDSLIRALQVAKRVNPDADSLKTAINNLVISGVARLRVESHGGVGHNRKPIIKLRAKLELNRD